MEELSLPPFAPVLMESTRALGYSLEAAIADLLDNSITANSKTINIKFWPFDEPYFAILDDGDGMSPDGLTNAMRYGSQNPQDVRGENDLGRFGLGLKTASLSQCRSMTVVSLKDGILSGRCWDLDVIKTREDWVLLILDQDELSGLPLVEELLEQGHGTIVIWRDLDRLGAGEQSLEHAFSSKMNRVREHLSLVFHRYLSGEPSLKKIQMLINGEPIEPIDPFLSAKSTQPMDDEIITIDDHPVRVRPYILPHLSKLTADEMRSLGGEEGLRKQQGFYVYRNRRLLVWGTWFRLLRQDELYKLARIRVDIPNTLDHLWTLDIRKSTAVPPDVVRKNLSRIVKTIAEGSKRTWTYRGKKEVEDTTVHVWNRFKTREGVRYGLNRDYPLVDLLETMLDSRGRRGLEQLLRTIESNLPLNSLYVDLTNDQKVMTEEDGKRNDLKELAIALLSSLEGNGEDRQGAIEKLKHIEPFSRYPELVEFLEEKSESFE